jgi:nitrate reductase NapE
MLAAAQTQIQGLDPNQQKCRPGRLGYDQATARMPSHSLQNLRERDVSVADNDMRGRSRRRRMEIFAFLFLTAVLMPALAVATVGSYGLAVWIYQMMAGPPGPPPPH